MDNFGFFALNSLPTCGVCPLSLSICLTTLLHASQGQTQAQILGFLQQHTTPQSDIDDYTKVIQSVQDSFVCSSEANGPILHLATSIWGTPINPEFAALIKKQLNVEVLNEVANADTINKWVQKQTNGMFRQILQQVNPSDFVLVNAMYFKGMWASKFDKANTRTKAFLTPEASVDCQMMFQKHKFSYYEQPKEYQLIELPYESSSISAFIMLPDATRPDLLHSFATKDFTEGIEKMKKKEVELELPRFELITESVDLIPWLKSNGVDQLFQSGQADLSRLSPEIDRISQFLHKVRVKVDEEGTEAAAVTMAVMTRMYIPPLSMTCNRPFLFFLREKTRSTDLIVARITSAHVQA